MKRDPKAVTAQGYDTNWGVNCLGSFFWTELIKPALLASADHTGRRARIISVSSFMHKLSVPAADGIDEDTLVAAPKRDEAISMMGGRAMEWVLSSFRMADCLHYASRS